MDLSPENRKKAKIGAAVAALLGALFFMYTQFSGGSSAATGGGPGSHPDSNPAAALVDPSLQLSRLNDEKLVYSGNGRNIFREGEEPMPTPVTNGRTVTSAHMLPTPIEPVVPPPYVPPPINLKFYGFASKPGQPKKIFLQDGEDIFVGSEGDVVDRHYKILHIGASSTDVEDLLNNNRQTLPLVAQGDRG